jgi:hypothetical protein
MSLFFIPPKSHAMEFDSQGLCKIDPDGDVILYTCNDPEAKASESEINKIDVPTSSSRFLVSSKHLKLASAYFQKMLSSRWAEGTDLADNGTAEIPVHECKAGTLWTVLNAIHGRFRRLPTSLSLDELVDISVATDFFQCHEVIESFANKWINKLDSTSSESVKLKKAEWIMIASVFRVDEILLRMSKVAMQEGTGPFETKGLPIAGFIKS